MTTFVKRKRDRRCYAADFADGRRGHKPKNLRNIALEVEKGKERLLPRASGGNRGGCGSVDTFVLAQ